ncbi:hypothetical protein CTI12_AA422380 [Artemisia annua]|uniref:Uncharacterized protein n=1 Tax=Artemisia annua TaxID=35608 RepID=A0A2U1M3V8_ARTAN|nr:hypothetical protein CTI12_AA422380 [Artemisia annua]
MSLLDSSKTLSSKLVKVQKGNLFVDDDFYVVRFSLLGPFGNGGSLFVTAKMVHILILGLRLGLPYCSVSEMRGWCTDYSLRCVCGLQEAKPVLLLSFWPI